MSDIEKLRREIDRLDDEVATDAANEQHYELPPGFFTRVLGPRLKYSSCIWPDGAAPSPATTHCPSPP